MRRSVLHPGKLIVEKYLKAGEVSGRELADILRVSPSTLSRVLDGKSAISPEMALRLSKALGRSAESWLVLQNRHDLDRVRRRIKLGAIKQLKATRTRKRLGLAKR